MKKQLLIKSIQAGGCFNGEAIAQPGGESLVEAIAKTACEVYIIAAVGDWTNFALFVMDALVDPNLQKQFARAQHQQQRTKYRAKLLSEIPKSR